MIHVLMQKEGCYHVVSHGEVKVGDEFQHGFNPLTMEPKIIQVSEVLETRKESCYPGYTGKLRNWYRLNGVELITSTEPQLQ